MWGDDWQDGVAMLAGEPLFISPTEIDNFTHSDILYWLGIITRRMKLLEDNKP